MSPGCRLTVFALASTSILGLLVEFYRLGSTRTFTLLISLPALGVLLAWALLDRGIGSQRLWRWIVVGSLVGLTAAFAYDIFRLPFVFARELGIERIVPPLPLFKVLRTTYRADAGHPVQQIGAHKPLEWTLGDLGNLPETEREAEAARRLRQETGPIWPRAC